MSRLQSYVKESIKVLGSVYTDKQIDTFIKFWDKVQKDCKPFLAEITKNNRTKALMYRGETDRGDWAERTPRKERYPKDTQTEWHNAFDEYFDNEFGWKARSQGLFCTGRKSTASSYGDPYIIFPAGRYKYIWSPTISDLYSEVSDGNGNDKLYDNEDLIDQWTRDYDEEYEEGTDNGEWGTDGTTYGLSGWSRESALEEIIRTSTEEEREELDELNGVLERKDKDEMDEYVYSSRQEAGEKSIKKRVSELERDIHRISTSIKKDLEWFPSIDLEGYIDERKNNVDDDLTDGMYYDAAESIVKGKYIEKDLVKALITPQGNEVMVYCKKYYIITVDFRALVENAIWNNVVDPRQLEFDFGDKKRGK